MSWARWAILLLVARGDVTPVSLFGGAEINGATNYSFFYSFSWLGKIQPYIFDRTFFTMLQVVMCLPPLVGGRY